MPTEAHKKRNDRYRKPQDQIAVVIPKGARDGIKERAASKGFRVNSYIVNLIEHDIGCSMKELAKKE